jgi:hypothetical protein
VSNLNQQEECVSSRAGAHTPAITGQPTLVVPSSWSLAYHTLKATTATRTRRPINCGTVTIVGYSTDSR